MSVLAAPGLTAERSRVTAQYRRRLALLGDSLTDFNSATLSETGGASLYYEARGWMTWATALMGRPFQWEPADNFGVASRTSAQMLVELPAIAAGRYDFCTVLGGTNDGGLAASVTISNLLTMYTTLLAVGTTVIALPIPPKGSGGYTTDQKQRNAYVNEWIRRYCAATPGMIFVDWRVAITDPATGEFYTWATVDGTHFSVPGAQAGGRVIQAALANLFPTNPSFGWIDQNDMWSATNPTGNMVVNPLLAGSPAVSAPFAGTGATSFNSGATGGTLTSGAMTWSTADRTDGKPGKWAVLTLASAVGAGTGAQLRLEQAITLASGKYAVGDILEFTCDVQLAAGSRGIQQIGPRIIETDGITPFSYYDLSNNVVGQNCDALAVAVSCKTPKFTIRPYAGTGTAQITVRLSVYADLTTASGADGAIKIGAPCLRKVG